MLLPPEASELQSDVQRYSSSLWTKNVFPAWNDTGILNLKLSLII